MGGKRLGPGRWRGRGQFEKSEAMRSRPLVLGHLSDWRELC